MLISILFGQGALLFGSILAAFARAESRERSAARTRAPVDQLGPPGQMAGMPLRILLSDRSGPGALLKDTLTHRPSAQDR